MRCGLLSRGFSWGVVMSKMPFVFILDRLSAERDLYAGIQRHLAKSERRTAALLRSLKKCRKDRIRILKIRLDREAEIWANLDKMASETRHQIDLYLDMRLNPDDIDQA